MTDHPQLTTTTTAVSAAALEKLPIDQLSAHPDNPRLALREDVVDRIAAELRATGFGPQHAILVRPHGEGWQVISGHHRWEAARRAGLATVPAWVKDMGDDEAFMQLVLSNAQGELSPLEIGTHALRAVPPGKGGRGRTGGLSEYARRLGRGESYLRQLRAAAEVLETSQLTAEFPAAQHLYEISKAPREVWPPLVAALVKHGWTVADAATCVATVKDFDVPAEHAGWLPLPALVAEHLTDDRFKPTTVTALARTADSVFAWIEENATDEHADEFRAWLLDRQGDRDAGSWSRRALSDYHADLIRRIAEEHETDEPEDDGIGIRAGDFRIVLADIPDDSVSLILTDPPYGDESTSNYADLAKFAARVLKPGGSLLAYAGQSTLPEVLPAMSEHLRYWWTLALEHNHGGQQLPGKWVMVEWKPIIWMVKDHRDGKLYVADRVRGTRPDKTRHEWAQGIDEVFYLIEQLTSPGELVCDPFAGSGSFGRAALELSRRFVGADLDPGSKTGQVVA